MQTLGLDEVVGVGAPRHLPATSRRCSNARPATFERSSASRDHPAAAGTGAGGERLGEELLLEPGVRLQALLAAPGRHVEDRRQRVVAGDRPADLVAGQRERDERPVLRVPEEHPHPALLAVLLQAPALGEHVRRAHQPVAERRHLDRRARHAVAVRPRIQKSIVTGSAYSNAVRDVHECEHRVDRLRDDHLRRLARRSCASSWSRGSFSGPVW